MNRTPDASTDYLSRLVALQSRALAESMELSSLSGINHVAYPLALAWRLDHPANALKDDPRLPGAAVGYPKAMTPGRVGPVGKNHFQEGPVE